MGGCISGLNSAGRASLDDSAPPPSTSAWYADRSLAGIRTRSLADLSQVDDRSAHNGSYYRSQTATLVASTPPAVLRQKLSPFLPRRVLDGLAACRQAEESSVNSQGDSASSVRNGQDYTSQHGADLYTPGWNSPEPAALQAAVLLVDVSGFTTLSELYSSQGPAGCEEFSLLIGELFEKLTVVIEFFGGDIDCFAGDAVLVVFPVQTDLLPGRADKAADNRRAATAAATLQALRCAEVVENRLSGFQKAPGDPPLTVHSALAVGTIHSVICGELPAYACRHAPADSGQRVSSATSLLLPGPEHI